MLNMSFIRSFISYLNFYNFVLLSERIFIFIVNDLLRGKEKRKHYKGIFEIIIINLRKIVLLSIFYYIIV